MSNLLDEFEDIELGRPLLEAIQRVGERRLGVEQIHFWRLDEANNRILTLDSSTRKLIDYDTNKAACGKAAMRYESVLSNDVSKDRRFDSSIDIPYNANPKSMLLTPIFAPSGERLGAMQSINHWKGVFDAESVKNASELALDCSDLLQKCFELGEDQKITLVPSSEPEKNPDETVVSGLGERSPAISIPQRFENPEELLGKNIGKYKITKILGQGGQGVVFSAKDEMLNRNVAIKMLLAEMTAKPMIRERFLQEARSAGKLMHPNVVGIYDVIEDYGSLFIVMEKVDGGNVSDLITESKLGWAHACKICIDACNGLAAAHRMNMIHRDIKPENIMIDTTGQGKLTDFGLAKGNDSLDITIDGQLMGTPRYMSPEQCKGLATDHRSDIYSLGATLFSMLSGEAPYSESESFYEIMSSHLNSPPPDPSSFRDDVPKECTKIIMTAMAKNPEERFQDIGLMLQSLQSILRKAKPKDYEQHSLNNKPTPAQSPIINKAANLEAETIDLPKENSYDLKNKKLDLEKKQPSVKKSIPSQLSPPRISPKIEQSPPLWARVPAWIWISLAPFIGFSVIAALKWDLIRLKFGI